MDDRADYTQHWQAVLAMYEVDKSGCDLSWQNRLARYLELARELLKCRGVEKLHPYTSMLRLCITAESEWPWSSSLRVELLPTGDYSVILTRSTWDGYTSETRTLLNRTCPHLRSTVRAIRVAARLMGVKISQPRREQPPPGATRRQWLIISNDGLFAPPRAKVYRELPLDGFASQE